MGQAIEELENIAEQVLPAGYSHEYGGESRYYQQSSATLPLTFGFSMVIIFLSLAALFESFRDPLIILISVPMSIFGALLFLNLGIGDASLNIYTQVGLVTLIGLISKHGILIVQFANSLQMEGKSKLDAITLAASIRLRPILMTTFAMVLGVIPLLIATGPGAESRFNIGLVVASGISIGTLFTLFVLPAMYLFLAKDHLKDYAKGEAAV
jgi:multidrug efflux pump